MSVESIKKTREFQILFKRGSSYVTYGFVCYYRANKPKSESAEQHSLTTIQKNRIGIVASKKVGNAVKRNRAKRVIREAFRIAEPILREKANTYDFVFVARGKTPYLKSTEIYKLIVNGLFKKI